MKNSQLNLLISTFYMGLSFVANSLLNRVILLILAVLWLISYTLSAKRELKMLEREIELLEKLKSKEKEARN